MQKGDQVATCGNSGRSPEPHIHFQVQVNPYIGSKTISHPISYYIERKDNKFLFRSFSIPNEGDLIRRVETTRLIKEAFNFVPGEEINFLVRIKNGKEERVKWEVLVNIYSQPYLYCHNTKSVAYFVNNETVHYFTDFYGDRQSLLYYFYLGAHKQLLGFYLDMEITDRLPLDGFYNGGLKFLQDIIAPFYIFLNTEFSSRFTAVDDVYHPTQIQIKSAPLSLKQVTA